jgi:hypothetical protein
MPSEAQTTTANPDPLASNGHEARPTGTKATSKRFDAAKLIETVTNKLNLLAQHGYEYALFLADKDMVVTQQCSTNARPFVMSANASATLPAAVFMSNMEREMVKLNGRNITFHELGKTVKVALVIHVLSCVMPKRKVTHPYPSSSTENVQKDYHWWPTAVPYQNPRQMSEDQLQAVIEAVAKGHKLDDVQRCLKTLYKMGLSPKEEQGAKIALNKAFAGTVSRRVL